MSSAENTPWTVFHLKGKLPFVLVVSVLAVSTKAQSIPGAKEAGWSPSWDNEGGHVEHGTRRTEPTTASVN